MLSLLGAIAVLDAPCSAEPIFEGYMLTSAGSAFVMSSGTNRISGWIAAGQAFDGYTVIAFDRKTEVLLVEKEGKRHTLPLKESSNHAGEAAIEEEPLLARIFSKSAVVMLADVRCDDKFIYVNVREVWKNLGSPLSEQLRLRRNESDGLGSALHYPEAIVRLEEPSQLESWQIAFTDGVQVVVPHGPEHDWSRLFKGPTVDSLRRYFTQPPNQSSQPTRSTGG